jgi:hypothetical protein
VRPLVNLWLQKTVIEQVFANERISITAIFWSTYGGKSAQLMVVVDCNPRNKKATTAALAGYSHKMSSIVTTIS